MSDGVPITGSPVIDRTIRWMTGTASTTETPALTDLSAETRTVLDFDAETPSPPEALLLRQHRRETDELRATILQLEKTAQRAIQDNEKKNEEIEALHSSRPQGSRVQPQAEPDSAAAIAALVSQVAMLATTMQDMQTKIEANMKPTNQTKERQGKYKGADSDSESNPNEAGEKEEEWLTDFDESGPASVTIFARAIRYRVTDPNRISDKKDVDGIDADYKRINDKRPHLLRDAANTQGKRGPELGDLARALRSRLTDSLEPEPSSQCVIGISVFALHDKGDATLQRKIQNALVAARNCKTANDVNQISRKCRTHKRIPAALITGSASFSDSPLIMAIKVEAHDGEDELIRALWNLVVQVIALDRSPAVTLNKLKTEWSSISCTDVEDALQQELNVHERAEKLLLHHKGNKAFSTFDSRVENILAARNKIHKSTRDRFYERLNLDNMTLIELSWDDIWDRVVNADLAASRQDKQLYFSPSVQIPLHDDNNGGDAEKQFCALHGNCHHKTIACNDIAALGADPLVIRKLKSRGLCVYDYYGGCKDPGQCKYKHFPTKPEYDRQIQHIRVMQEANKGIQMPATKDDDPDYRIQMPMKALGFPDEPPLPDGLCCGAVVKDDEHRVHFPCVLTMQTDYSDSDDSLYE